MSMNEFRKTKWNNPNIQPYCRNQSTPKTTVLKDQIMNSILQEQGFSILEDPASIYNPQDMYDKLERYAPSHNTTIEWNQDWERAFRTTFKVYAKPKKLELLNATMEVKSIRQGLHMEKSSGLPALTKKEDDFFYAYDRAIQVMLGDKRPSPCIAYPRTSHGSKTRLVWGYPLEMTILETIFARPLIDTYLERRTTMAFGMSNYTLGAYISQIDHAYGRTVALDYSKFDSTINTLFIQKAFSILETWFSDLDRQKYSWDKMVDYFIKTPILMPNGNVYTGKEHGVPSGSYFTQIIDSIVNTMIQFYLANTLKYSLNWEKLLVLGDDVLVSIPEEISFETVSEELLKIGIVTNPDKCREEAHFLGASWIKGIPYRDIEEIKSRLVYTERHRIYRGKDYESKRQEAIAIMLSMTSQYANAYILIPRPLPYRFDALEDYPLLFKTALKLTTGQTGFSKFKKEYIDKNRVATDLLSARLLS